MEGDRVKVIARLDTKRFYNEEQGFGIIVCTVKKVEKGTLATDPDYTVFKGNMANPMPGAEYIIEGIECKDKRWGIQYNINNICLAASLGVNTKEGQRKFLEVLFTEGQVEALYEALGDPYDVLKRGDVAALTTVKGCGFKTAAKWIARFEKDIGKARIFEELEEYELTTTMIDKLMGKYKSVDLVIQNVKKNPYILMEIRGIGWKKCDALALKGGIGIYSNERVGAFIKYYLETAASNGYTYLLSDQLMAAIMENLGEDIPDEPIGVAIKHLEKELWWSEDKEKIGLKRYVELEKRIAKKLIELRDGPNNFKYDGWQEIIKEKERKQGWEYSEQQIKGIQATLENQVVLITGYGGTGKSSIVAGVIEVLKDYSFAQCALSGRAAARLAEVTNTDGYTIHRLLGYPLGEENKGGFMFNDECPLAKDIIIVDEISMVDGELFYALIRALRPGTKLIMLGDVGQLESIGCSNIANDLIKSPEITSVMLDKIHRQAAASAIITDSIQARNGIQVIDKDFVGTITKGDLQDLTYDCYSDPNNTLFKITQEVSNLIASGISIYDLQVIVPNKDRQAGTWMINQGIQGIVNDASPEKKELYVHYDKNHDGVLREGDKVINVQNNYKAVLYTGQWEHYVDETEEKLCPVFNGNMGVIEAIDTDRQQAIVNFIGIGRILVKQGMLKTMMLGYAVTVHKCQGSEFPYVIFGCDFSAYVLLSRQLVYTAITRAKKHCWIKAQTSALRYAITQNAVSLKQTLLQEALYEAGHPKYEF